MHLQKRLINALLDALMPLAIGDMLLSPSSSTTTRGFSDELGQVRGQDSLFRRHNGGFDPFRLDSAASDLPVPTSDDLRDLTKCTPWTPRDQ